MPKFEGALLFVGGSHKSPGGCWGRGRLHATLSCQEGLHLQVLSLSFLSLWLSSSSSYLHVNSLARRKFTCRYCHHRRSNHHPLLKMVIVECNEVRFCSLLLPKSWRRCGQFLEAVILFSRSATYHPSTGLCALAEVSFRLLNHNLNVQMSQFLWFPGGSTLSAWRSRRSWSLEG